MTEHPGRHRAWCFTINNHTDDDVAMLHLVEAPSTYLVAGLEVGEEGTPHIQGYVYFQNARTFAAMKKMLPRAHLAPAKGTGVQNKAYCTKDGNILIEAGTVPIQGRRFDIEDVYASLRAGHNMRKILDQEPNYQCIQITKVWLTHFETERNFVPEVKWFFGPPGSGKTKAALEWLGEDTYICSRTTSKFWEGYDAHQGALIDDFRVGWCKFEELLGMTDRVPYKVETKGGSRQLLARKMAFTCPYEPTECFSSIHENLDQLTRRISEIHGFSAVPRGAMHRPTRFLDGVQIPDEELISEDNINPENGIHHGYGLPRPRSSQLRRPSRQVFASGDDLYPAERHARSFWGIRFRQSSLSGGEVLDDSSSASSNGGA